MQVEEMVAEVNALRGEIAQRNAMNPYAYTQITHARDRRRLALLWATIAPVFPSGESGRQERLEVFSLLLGRKLDTFVTKDGDPCRSNGLTNGELQGILNWLNGGRFEALKVLSSLRDASDAWKRYIPEPNVVEVTW